MSLMKLRLKRLEADILDVMVFVGERGATLQNAGHLRLHVGEWQEFGAALLFGQQKMAGRFSTEVEGEKEALR
jgi:hypothetical protein